MFSKYLMFGNYLRMYEKVCVDLLCLTNLTCSLEVMENEHQGSVHRQDFSSLKINSTQTENYGD